MTKRRCAGAGGLALLCTASAVWAQVQSPVGLGMPRTPEDREWRELITREHPREWQLTYRVNALIALCGGIDVRDWSGYGGSGREPAGAHDPIRMLFVAPWVSRSASQVVDTQHIRMDLEINGSGVTGSRVWMQSSGVMEQLPGIVIESPPGLAIDLRTRSVPEDIWACGNLRAEVSYAVTAHQTNLNEREATQAQWPDFWSTDVGAALGSDVFMTSAVDARTKAVREIDLEALDEFVRSIAKVRDVKDVRQRQPLAVVRDVARDLSRRVLPKGDPIVPSRGIQSQMKRVAGGAGKINPFQNMGEQKGMFQGFGVRDALTVLRDGHGSLAERATVLAAVYRRLGIPARVVIGVVGVEDDDEKTIRKLSEKQQKDRTPSPAKPSNKEAGRDAARNLAAALKPPEFRFWVEVALFHPDRGVAWIPVDLGRGGETWKIGQVPGGERTAVLATNWWPHSTTQVGSFFPGEPGQVNLRAVQNADGSWHLEGTTAASGPTQFRCGVAPNLAAGLWGYAVAGAPTSCWYQDIGVEIQRVSKTPAR